MKTLDGNPPAQTITLQDPTEITDPLEAKRLEAIDQFTAPYHIHFVDGAEGYELNPEGSQYNFDASIMLTELMHKKQEGEFGHIEDISEWFFAKYPHGDINAKQLRKPASVVRTWLSKLGPHNDMVEAEDDLAFARRWMLETHSGRRQTDSENNYGSKEFRLVADIDLELAEIVDDDLRELYLEEALTFLEYSKSDHLEKGDFGYATLDQAMIASVKIELARREATGTGQLTNRCEPGKYDELEDITNHEHGLLEESIVRNIENILETIEKTDTGSGELDKISRDNIAVMFEAVTYYSLLEEIIDKKALTAAKVRLGTLRQESGSTHNISTENDTDSTEPRKGFNFNYDVEYTQLNDRDHVRGEGLYRTIYLQNKLNPKDTKPDEARDYSQRFLAGKEFRFVTPPNLMHFTIPKDINTQKEAMVYFTQVMKDFVLAQDSSGVASEISLA
jgi:hypothetical protein